MCCGLSCVDMMLMAAERPKTLEAITSFDGTKQEAGGSCSNTSRVLGSSQIRVLASTLLGDDPHGKELLRQLNDSGVNTDHVVIDPEVNTSLAVLPVFKGGGRGCYVDLGANSVATPEKLFGDKLDVFARVPFCKVFHFGYPHLMGNLQGENLDKMFSAARRASLLVSLDINGADKPEPSVITEALRHCFFVHANLEEAAFCCFGASMDEENATVEDITSLGNFFLSRGAGVVSISLGADGAYLATNTDPDTLEKLSEGILKGTSAGLRVFRGPYMPEGAINSTGAGDAFVAGALAYTVSCLQTITTLDPNLLLDYALISACLHIDAARSVPTYEELGVILSQTTRLPSKFC
uniref:Carbohydrate kinase PfkB domain-containing protein n=1 Tax=Rhodosorus marinus TaxID=101924 RepID=A0A7S0BLA4_9RHOD